MSKETLEWLANNTLIGYADKRGSAWHGRQFDTNNESNHYDGAIPLDDVLRRIINWEALSAPIQYVASITDNDGNETEVEVTTDKQAIYRSDTGALLGTFAEGYRIHQYKEWLIDEAANIVDKHVSDVDIANVVMLRGGGVCAVQYELPDMFETREGIKFRPSLLSATSLNGTVATTFKETITNVVCDNTLDAALYWDEGKVAKFKHTKYSVMKLEEVRTALGIQDRIVQVKEAFEAEAEALLNVKVTGKQFNDFIKLVAPLEEKNVPLEGRSLTMATAKRDKLESMYLNDSRVNPWMGTKYGILQLGNTWNQHEKGTNAGTVRYERNFFDAVKGNIAKFDAEFLATLDLVLANA